MAAAFLMNIERRDFLKISLLTGSAALIAPRALFPQSADARIEILINEPIATVNPNLYSHFVEHLGGVVYDGIWVGEKSKIPNVGGIRKEIVDKLAKPKPRRNRCPRGWFF